MALDPRDAIWNETHELLYNASYVEEISQLLLARWTWLDSGSRITVAIASAGSALAGLVFWKNPDYAFLWPLFTSASALLALISKQLNVVEKVKHHALTATETASLGIEIGSMIVRMRVNPLFSIAEFEHQLLAFRERYRLEVRRFEYDLLLTERLRLHAQERLNVKRATSRPKESGHD